MAVGSTVARGVSHAMGWNGYSAPPPAAAEGAAPADSQSVSPATSPYGDFQQGNTGFQQDQLQQGQQCELFATDFRNCLSATKGDPSPCQYYL